MRRRCDLLTFTASGYGLSYSSPVAIESIRSRLMAESRLISWIESVVGEEAFGEITFVTI